MKKRIKKIVAVLLTLVLTSSILPVQTANAEEEIVKTVITDLKYEAAGTGGTSYIDSYIRADDSGQYLWVTGTLTTESGEPLLGRSVKVYYIKDGTTSKRYSSGTTDEKGVFHARIGGKSYFTDGSTYKIYAEFVPSSTPKGDKDTYETATSEEKIFNIKKQEQPELTINSEHQTKGDGSISVVDSADDKSYQYAVKNPTSSGNGNADLYEFTGDIASGLSKGTYYVRAKAYVSLGGQNILYLASDYVTVAIDSVDYNEYKVVLEDVENASWKMTGGKNEFLLKEETGYLDVYLTPDENYIVDNVYLVPEDGADLNYNNATGEVYISNIKQDVKVFASTSEIKQDNSSLEVKYEFLKDSVDGESVPTARVKFTFTVKDEDGNPASGVKVYFKGDENEVSYYYNRETDEKGEATVTENYTVGDYIANATLDKDSGNIVEQPIHIVKQPAPEYLPADAVTPARTNQNEGTISGLDDRYEYFTNPLSDGEYFNYAAGEWKAVEDGKIIGLEPGFYAIRYKEYADYDNDTLYLYSDYRTVEIKLATESRRVTPDVENSQNVKFVETELLIEQNGTAYLHVTPDEGYVIVSYEVDNPNYIRTIDYSEDGGYVVITGITGSISVRVLAEENTANTLSEPESETETTTDIKLVETITEPETTTSPEETTIAPQETESEVITSEENTTTETIAAPVTGNLKSPKTGDRSPIIYWMVILMTSLFVMTVYGSKMNSLIKGEK